MKKYFILCFLFPLSFSIAQERGKIQEKVEVHVVLVPAVVMDKKGNFVDGLKKEDFEILEDGKKQELSLFYLKEIKEGRYFIQEESKGGLEKQELKENISPRTIVIIFDQNITRLSYITRMRNPLENFLKRFLNKDDTLIIYVGSIAYLWRKGAFTIAGTSDSVSDIIKNALLLSLTTSGLISFGDKSTGASPLDRAEVIVFQFLAREHEMLSIRNLKRFKAIAEELKRIEGEKTVILLSEGYGLMPLYTGHEITDPAYLAKIFNDSNTSIYSLDIGGLRDYESLYGNPRISGEIGELHRRLLDPSFQKAFLRYLSHETGGEAIVNINDMNEGLQRIGSIISKTYILGYSPTNKKMDGRYRKIKVKVKRKNVEIRHRKGYFAVDMKEEEFKELEGFLVKERKAKIEGLEKEKDLKIDIEVLTIQSWKGSFTVFSIQPRNLGLTPVTWEEEEKQRKILRSRFSILIQLEKDRNVLEKARDEIYFSPKEEELKQGTYVYWISELEEGKYILRVVIKDRIRGILQSEEKNFEVSPEVAKDGGIGRFFLVNESNLIRSLSEESSLPEIHGRRIYPRTNNEFSPNEILPFFFEYMSNKYKEDIQLNIEVFKGDELIKTFKEQILVESKSTFIYRGIPLNEFAAGEYILQIRIVHSDEEHRETKIFKIKD